MSNIDNEELDVFLDDPEDRTPRDQDSAPGGGAETGLMGPGRSSSSQVESLTEASGALSGEESEFREDAPMDPDSGEEAFQDDFPLEASMSEASGSDGADYGDDSEIGFIVIDPPEDEEGAPPDSDDAETPECAPDQSYPSQDLGFVSEQISGLSQQMEQLSRDFESKLKYDSHKEKIIDSLHGELQEYKDGLLKKHMQSMVMDILKIIDDVRKIVRYYREKELSESDLPKLLDILEDLPSDLEDAFSFQGIRPYTCEGDAFNPSRQRVLQKIATQDESLDKKVAKRLLPGYEWDDTIIRLEMVGVYTYKPVSED
ncbi:Molecular chaperone GrpE (heat shock protein)-like protein [Desulfatibacillum aliphaticivorans]|uniref:Molecular chaperone GrpE (Heat shock protein)-like protein n=1 Tax=Desulfatibacillum aliphaticivorans TaxID=218208 RepID=B8F996_DESAL|nr:nucleotide exchange factor GrpE [Desulfatibacillum aliphaticivorans]ACL02842.1 Molecular chaperone GrpE (heat shock protein)-like protein [Desulfatibacillum aliphaticivorans]